MNLKAAFEELRGQAIGMLVPVVEVPCIETSDAEKLCKNPVVSVHMITYNHEPYIRQAIEGVMMQQTDFEFELIIGEDCSQDKTREICFEYQKKYPDKIRVLWSESNVYHMGGNSRRVFARCRGEFIAFCEGDDYWTDPHKLQRQVDFLRSNEAYSAIAENGEVYVVANGSRYLFSRCTSDYDVTLSALIAARRFPTAGVLLRSTGVEAFLRDSRFMLDTIVWSHWATLGKFRYSARVSSVYRKGMQGVTMSTPRIEWARKHEQWYLELFRLYGHRVKERSIRHNIWHDYVVLVPFYLRRKEWRLANEAFRRAFRYMPMRTFCYCALGYWVAKVKDRCNAIICRLKSRNVVL